MRTETKKIVEVSIPKSRKSSCILLTVLHISACVEITQRDYQTIGITKPGK